MNANRYYEALQEGRYRPTVNIDKTEKGQYRAWFEDGQGHSVEFVDDSSTFAHNQVLGLIMEGVREGRLLPF